MRFGKREETSTASNPGRVEVKPLVYARFFPRTLRRLALGVALLVVGVVSALATGGVSLLLLLIGVRLVLQSARRLRSIARHYRLGNALPGIVVDDDPYVIATITDLSTGDHAVYLAVKVLTCPGLAKVRDRTFAKGDRVPCIALYSGRMPAPKWDTFNPVPAILATDDATALARLEASIPESNWAELNEALFQIPKPYRNGLFQVTLPEDEAASPRL